MALSGIAMCFSVNAADEGYQYMTNAQISVLSPDQVASISEANLRKLPANFIAYLVNPSRSDNEPYGNIVKVHDWQQNHAIQETRLSNCQISNISNNKFMECRAFDFASIAPEKFQNFNVQAINAEEISYLLNPSKIPETEITTYEFETKGYAPLLSINQMINLHPNQLAALRFDDLDNLSNECIQSLTIEQINALSARSISYLINPSRFVAKPNYDAEEEAEIDKEQPLISKYQFQNLTPVQFRSITPKAYSNLPNGYIASLQNDSKRMLYPNCLSPEKFAQLPDNELRNLTDDQLRRLTLDQISRLNPQQLALFNLVQLPAKNVNYAQNIQQIPPVRIRTLPPNDFNRLLFE